MSGLVIEWLKLETAQRHRLAKASKKNAADDTKLPLHAESFQWMSGQLLKLGVLPNYYVEPTGLASFVVGGSTSMSSKAAPAGIIGNTFSCLTHSA